VVDTKEPTAGHRKSVGGRLTKKLNLALKLPTVQRISKSLHIITSSSLLAKSFCLLFNRLSFVTPIFENGKRNDVSNYHGIAILLTVGKLFKLLVYRHRYEDLRGQLADCQNGFVKGMSTVSNRIVEYSAFVLKSTEDGCQVDSIYTDFSKAFDKVRHRVFLDKISTSVEPSRCQWLGSYFSGIIQRVRMSDCVSRDVLVTKGVS
jgi:hypothetical protein